ncbi:MAG: hypothetical protein ACP5VN_01080 [Acidobacteriota bacterium]
MDGWLPEGFENGGWEERAGRALRAVKAREARRRRRVRASAALAACALLFALLYTPGLLRRIGPHPAVPSTPSPSLQAQKAPAARVLEAPLPPPATAQPAPAPEHPRPLAPRRPAEVTPILRKERGAVVVTWPGDPNGEYVVYKCQSPAFDTCTRKAEVQGTSWADGEMDTAPVVFYKVERKA